jgi:general secretion pathway protein H
MPTSGRGSDRPRGFTLIELLVVIAIIALTASLVAVALRDGGSQRLEREGERLVVLLETARAESRASGLPVWWLPGGEAEAPGFRFVGLSARQTLPSTWLDPEIRAAVDGGNAMQLGPEALIGAQRVLLTLGEQRLAVATDGLGPFEIRPGADE